MATISVGPSELYYETFGNGPAVVFVHGVGGNHASWFAQVGAFAPYCQVVTFDQRGFGNSPDEEQLGRDAMADDLLRLLDALKLERATLVAQSMGGGPCIDLTCRDPQRVSALVLADTLIGLRLDPDLEAKMAPIRAATANLSQVERVIGRRTNERRPDQTFLYLQIASFNRVTAKTIRGKFPLHTVEELAETRVPVQFVVGEDDVLMPPEIVCAVRERLPGSRLYQIAEVGHSAHFEAPDAFNACVLDYLREVGAVRA
ncbi:MAG: alpha/beta fold hydrolase [Thermomicrobiales bacterium]